MRMLLLNVCSQYLNTLIPSDFQLFFIIAIDRSCVGAFQLKVVWLSVVIEVQ